jgi:outer membrane lipoprotein-sorting protein
MFTPWRPRLGQSLLFAVAGLISLAAAGCTRGIEAKPVAEELRRPPPKDAMELLERVVEAYHKADSYEDDGKLLLRYTSEGKTYEETSEFSLTLDGPNRMRLRAYDALVVCDGQNFRATIEEAPDEVLSYPAPDELSLGTVYRDLVLGRALNQVVGSVPLSLFLDPEPLPGFQYNARSPELDTPEKIRGDVCYRVRIKRREGAIVLWIDEKTLVVRRVEYPAEGYRRMFEHYPGQVTALTITAEHENARLNPRIDEAKFHLDMPAGAELVKQFDFVLVGGRIPRFKLHGADGKWITRESLAGKIAVIKFWRKDDLEKFRDDLATFEEVQKRYQEQDAVVFLPVNVDEKDVSDEDLKTALAKAGLSLPVVRIDVRVAFRSFPLQVVPFTVILGRDGTLQEYMQGVYPDQSKTLPKSIDTLLAGGELVLEPPQQPRGYESYAGFHWQNPLAAEDEMQPTTAPEFAQAEIAPASEPELLRLKRLWSSKQVSAPGNMLVVHEESGDRVFVLDEASSVAEVGADGKMLFKRPLELLEDGQVAFLRTAVDGSGRRFFLASAIGAKQLYLFDQQWKRRLVFPEESDSLAISDVQLSDLNGDGELEMLVGYVGLVGTHCVDLQGRSIWRNRVAENVLHLAVTAPDRSAQRQLLVAQGMLLPLESNGNEGAPIILFDSFLRLIFTSDLGVDRRSPWCAIATKPISSGKRIRDVAIGISPTGKVLWRYPLPAGTHHHAAFEMVAVGDVLGGGTPQWVIAGPDGSIHILALDGSFLDRFNYGAAPSGIAIAQLDGKPTLLLATDDRVEAWQFELPPE